MRPVVPVALATLLLAMTLLSPAASAEFGPESEDGWPINIHGEEMRPPLPEGHIVDMLSYGNPYEPLNKAGPVTLYPYYPILTGELIRLSEEYPHLVKLTSAGKSHAQLDLWMLEIADFENPDQVPLEDREVVYIDGGIHSNEYSAVYFLTEIAQFLIEEYETNETAKWIVENRHIWMIPMVNPDGSNAFGRMNANWVNVNRNFPGSWGEVDENVLLNNPGPEPGSEPETQAVLDVLDRLDPDYVNSIHCCGNLWLHPWGAEHLKDEYGLPDEAMFTRTCDEVFADVRDDCGEIWSTIYPASGTTADEGYHRLGASSWTYEMSGRGAISLWGQPAIIDDVREQEKESWQGILHALVNVHKYGAHPEVVDVAGDSGELEITIENVGWGPLVAGTLTLGDQQVAIGEIGPEPREADAPRNETTVTVSGDFAAGDEITLTLDWTKRIRHAQQGEKEVHFTLVEHDGQLVGQLADGPSEPRGDDNDENIGEAPASLWIGVLLVATLAVGLLRRRR